MAISDSQKWFMLAALLVGAGLIYLLAPILTPFLIAALLAYLGDPLADRLQALRLPRSVAVLVVFILIIAVFALTILLLVPVIENQLTGLINAIPSYIEWINRSLAPWLQKNFGVQEQLLDREAVQRLLTEHWQQAGGIVAYVLTTITRSGLAIFAWLVNLVLIPVVTFYLLRDWDKLKTRLRELLPRDIEPTVVQLTEESDDVLGGFLRGQLLVMLGLTAMYSTGLWLIGVEFALVIGIIAGLVSFVPYLGFIVGIVIAGLAVIVQTQDILQLILVVIVFGAAQMVEGMLLTPLLVGDRIGLHPVVVIFAVLAGGQLFGFFGVLLALPAAAVLAVLVRHWVSRYVESHFYDSDAPPEPDKT